MRMRAKTWTLLLLASCTQLVLSVDRAAAQGETGDVSGVIEQLGTLPKATSGVGQQEQELYCPKEDTEDKDGTKAQLSAPSGRLLSELFELFRHDMGGMRMEDMASSSRDLESRAMVEFFSRVRQNFLAVQDLETVPETQWKTFFKEPLEELMHMREEEYNHLNARDRRDKIVSLLEVFYEKLGDDKNRDILKKYLRMAGPPGDQKYAAFIDSITSFKDPVAIAKLFEQYPDLAPSVFIRREVKKAEGPTVIINRLRRPANVENMDFTFAPLGVIQGIYRNYEGISSVQGKTKAIPTANLEVWTVQKGTSGGEDEGERQRKALKVLKRMAATFLSKNIYSATQTIDPNRAPHPARLFESPEAKTVPNTTPSEETVFSIRDTNSAEHGSSGISIFRNEEAMKTLTHEIHHDIGAEDPFKPLNEEGFALEHFAIQRMDKGGTPLMTEALTEALAIVSHVGLCALEMANLPKGGTGENVYKEKFKDLWHWEKSFMLFQMAKLLYLAGFDNLEEFTHPQATKKRFKESTSTAEYHILKGLLLYDVENFLHAVMMPAHGPRKENNVIKSELTELMLKNGRDPKLREGIDHLISSFKKMKEEGKSEFFATALFQTQRMSLVEN